MNLTLEKFRNDAMREIMKAQQTIVFIVDRESLVVHRDKLLTGINGKLMVYTDSSTAMFVALIGSIKADPEMKAAFNEAIRFVNSGGIVESEGKTTHY